MQCTSINIGLALANQRLNKLIVITKVTLQLNNDFNFEVTFGVSIVMEFSI